MARDEGQQRPGSAGAPRDLAALADRQGVPAIDVAQATFPLANLELIPFEIARRYVVLPIEVEEDTIVLAMAEPAEKRVIDELEFVSGRRVFPYAAHPADLAQVIDRAYEARQRGETTFGPGASPGRPRTGNTAGAEPGRPRTGNTQGAAVKQPRAVVAPSLGSGAREVAFDDDDDLDLESGAGPSAPPNGHSPSLDSVFAPLPQLDAHTLLVVDDEEDIRRMLRRVFEEKGYHVIEADRGSVALHMVKHHMPDVILLDAMLPELHGFDICRRIKASARYGHIPIVMISAVYRGWRFAEDLKAAYGVSAYLEKPFRLADVVATVESALARAPKADGRDPEALTAEAESALANGMAAYRAGDLETAIAHLRRGIDLDPLSYRLHYHLALLLGRRNDVFGAIQELETSINLNPKSFAALKNLAVLYQKAGFRHKAIEMWERAIAHSPDDATRGQIKEHLMSLL